MIDYELLPEHIRGGARLYLEQGIKAGSFLMACFEDKLVNSFGQADATNRAAMPSIVQWLYNECPMQARGSEEKVRQWVEPFEKMRRAMQEARAEKG